MPKRPKRPKPKLAKVSPLVVPNKNDEKIDYPIFCFKYLQTSKCKDHKCYSDLIIRLQKLSTLGWKQIEKSPRHSFGTEPIPRKRIKPKLPNFITPDVRSLTVFRSAGNNKVFIGMRSDNIFHIIFIEENFGDIYDHG